VVRYFAEVRNFVGFFKAKTGCGRLDTVYRGTN